MKERTIDAIYLCPNNNIQGGHVYMNLSTGKRITRNKITPVPLSEVVKNRVEQMAADQEITCMKLSTGKWIARNEITPVPLSEVVKNRVEQMAVDQGITHVKFTNKKGIELPNADWIAGVDYDIDYNEINDHEKDDTYEYQQDVDENLNVVEEEID